MRSMQKKALFELDTCLKQHFHAKRLTSKSASSLDLPFTKGSYGWIVPTQNSYEGQLLSIVVLPTSSFPFEIPKIYVRPALPMLIYPHVENDGKLCVWSKKVHFDPKDINYIIHLVNDTNSLLEKNLVGKLTSDFNDGFLSYWQYAYPQKTNVYSLCQIGSNGIRQIYVNYTKKEILFADSKERLEKWFKNIKVELKQGNIAKSFLLTIDVPWSPENYPKSLSEIIQIIIQKTQDSSQVDLFISDMLKTNAPYPMFLIQVSTSNGYTVVGMNVETNAHKRGNGKLQSPSPLLGNGFRKGKIDAHTLLKRAIHLKVYGVNVERKDPDWILGRGENKALSIIKRDIIGIIGLGSVGSGILPLLVRAGFSKFALIDEDIFEAANIGRHWLGDCYVGVNKAKACAQELKKMFPWVEILHVSSNDWFSEKNTIESLKKCDLIISATGEWSSDVALSELQQKQVFSCPIVFCFTEAHAVSTHCYISINGKSNYRKLFTNTGELKLPVVKFDQKTHKNLPSCGGFFQPYGGVELSFGHSMIAETIVNFSTQAINTDIYKVWIGNKRLVTENGGIWNPNWISINGNITEGGQIVTATV